MQVLLQTDRLKIAPGLHDAGVLINELRNFKVKISTAGHDSYEAWREGVHDDLVLALGLACWRGERTRAMQNAAELAPAYGSEAYWQKLDETHVASDLRRIAEDRELELDLEEWSE